MVETACLLFLFLGGGRRLISKERTLYGLPSCQSRERLIGTDVQNC
jgi:hypothetical protein